jgi:L-alanine-DL-glutamate epimerase-like enolase superfamily enzyme
MEITDVAVVGQDIPLADDFPVSYEDHRTTDHVFVRLRTDDGTTGDGEGTALPWFTGETTRSMVAFLDDWLVPRIEGSTVEDATRELATFGSDFPHNAGGKAAVELALLDLQSKRAGVPLWELLGVRHRGTVPCVYPVPGLSPERAREVAESGVDAGYRRFKIKATGDIPADVARIDAVLDQLPADATARVDANTGWETYPRAKRAITAIADTAKIEYFEQPVAPDRPEDLQKLWEDTGIPVYADEFVHAPSDVERIGREGLARGCHLKLAKTGSLRTMADMARTADRYRLNATAVSAFGTSLEATAILHLAAVIPAIPAACELDPALLADDPTDGPLVVGPETPVPDGPGIGVSLDDSLFE